MKKIVKIAVAVMAIFAMTNFIACSTGGDSEGNTETEAGTGGSTGGTTGGETGGSTGGTTGGETGGTTGGETGGTTGGTTGGETGGTGGSTGEVKPVAGEYKVVFGDVVIVDGLTLEAVEEMAKKCNLVKDTDYTINETTKTITLTATGMTKVETAGGEGDHDHTGEGGETGGEGGEHEHPVAGEYKVVYGDKMIAEGLTMEAAEEMAKECNLVKDTDYTINEETKTITLTATGMEKVAAAEGGEGEGGVPVTVNATWNFSASPEGFPKNDGEADAITDFAIAAGEGSGATLTATGRWKFNSGLQGGLQAQATSSVSVSDIAADTWLGSASKAKYLTLTLAGDASVTVNFCGAGGADGKRFVGLLDSSNAVVWSEGSLDSAVPVTKTVKLSAGVYKIAANGSRITAITCE